MRRRTRRRTRTVMRGARGRGVAPPDQEVQVPQVPGVQAVGRAVVRRRRKRKRRRKRRRTRGKTWTRTGSPGPRAGTGGPLLVLLPGLAPRWTLAWPMNHTTGVP
jgi:hypothetical protein